LIWSGLISELKRYGNKEQCQVKISNRFAALEILDDNDDDEDEFVECLSNC